MSEQACFYRHTQAIERRIAKKLIDELLRRGYSISVFDSEEFTLKRSTSRADIINALATTDSDTLRVRDSDGELIGHFILIWGNGEDLISDFSAKSETFDLMDSLFDFAAEL